MSKKITHEQIKEIFYRIYYHIENIPRKELIDHYFLQQEKQEKLLELYRLLFKASGLDFFDTELVRQIKELENEQKIKEIKRKNKEDNLARLD